MNQQNSLVLGCLVHRDRFRDRPRMYGLHVLDRVGCGDGFAAGLIYGLLAGASVERALAYGRLTGPWS